MSSDKFCNIPMFLLGLLMMLALDFTDAQIGVCNGRRGSVPPEPSKVVDLYHQYNIQKMRLYDPDDEPTLQALGGSNIELLLDVPNDHLEKVASSQDNANNWVQTYVVSHSNVNFKYIAVGNEVSPLKLDTSQYKNFVLPALRNIHTAIAEAGLGDRIKVSTAIETGMTENTSPPSNGQFKSQVREYITPIIQFLVSNGSPLLVNIYPYFAYADKPGVIPLDYALFKSEGIPTPDGVLYKNLFAAMLDGTYSALEKAGGSALQIVVSESGWPTEGGTDTNTENARTYNNNLVQRVKEGTPKKPVPVETYIFAMFDEDLKEPELEKHWGLFSRNTQPKYQVNFN